MSHSILAIGDVLVSSEVIDTYFHCDLGACQGACCIEGESGAPLLEVEEELIRVAYPLVADEIQESNKAYIKKHGLMYVDGDGDVVTNIVEGGRCVFTCFEQDGSCRCAFEKGYTEGRNDLFYKPISCHLYPIRATQLRNGSVALNYDRWYPICEPALAKGRRDGVRLYQFVKEPLIRAFGEEWYEELVAIAEVYLQQKEGRDE